MSNTTNSIPYVIKTNGSVTLYLNSECLTVATDHPNYNKIVEAIKAGDFSNIESLVNVAKAVTKYGVGRIRVENGQVFYGSLAVHNTLTERIIRMMEEGFKFDHMIKFLDNLMMNPSARAVNETYTFLENFGLPITEDGCFLAYKAVRNDYTDIYSGTFFNGVGSTVTMARNQVDDNYGVDCSKGLHVGALDYVVGYGHFTKGQVVSGGNRLLVVKVSPADVVSVPKYEGHTKMRVCKYVVVSEIVDVVKELDKVVYTSSAAELAPDCPCDGCGEQSDDADGWDDTDEDLRDEDTVEETDEQDADEEFNAGFDQGEQDLSDGFEYQANLELDASDSFKDGYYDGYYNS